MTTLTFKRGDTWKARFFLYDDADDQRFLVLAPLNEDLPTGTAVDVTSIDARLQVRDRNGTMVYECDLLDDLSLNATPASGLIHWAADPADTTLVAPGGYLMDLEVTIASEVISTDTTKVKVLADVTYTET
jgi:hypothetical protein